MTHSRILIVDDDPEVRQVLAEQLWAPHREVATAADGVEGLATAATFLPHLVITDVNMPGLSGWDLVIKLREHKATAVASVIFATAAGARIERLRGLRLGAVDYMVKPLDLEELELRVASALGQNERARAVMRRILAGGVAGSLSHLPLGSLLQVLALEHRSGVLDVHVEGLDARVLLREGDVVGARAREEHAPHGVECVYALLRATDGQFAFTEAEISAPDEIRMPTVSLLLQGAKALDELSASRTTP